MVFDFLNLSFDEMVNKYPFAECVSRERKAISFTGGNELETFSNDSDVILYYDCLKPETPLMVVERITDEEIKQVDELDAFVGNLKKLYPEYAIYYDIVEDKEYVDITVVKRNVYDALQETEP